MPRGRVARGLELEAALAGEEAWALREAVASMAGSLNMEVDSPPLLRTELSGDGSISAPGPPMLNRVILNVEEESLEVPSAQPLKDSSERLNSLTAMQKMSQVKRKRATSAVNTSNTVHVSSPTHISPAQKRSRRELSTLSTV